MQKELFLNLLNEEAHAALASARQLALWRGGVLSPLHLLIAALEQLLSQTPRLRHENSLLLLRAHEVLATRFPLPGTSITVTKETQSVFAAAATLAQAPEPASHEAPSRDPIGSEKLIEPLHLLRAALASHAARQLLDDVTGYEDLLGKLEARHQETKSEASQPAQPSDAAESATSAAKTQEIPASSATSSTTASATASSPIGASTAGVSRSLTGALAAYCADLFAESQSQTAHAFVGREREMLAVLETLCRKLKNNPLLIGKPGVGKTALVAAVAERLCVGDVPPRLRGKRILEVSRLRLLADAKYAGDIEERLKQLLEEVQLAGDVILFFDEIHTLLNAGGAGGTGDIANLLKSSLSKGEITCIGATTLAEYYKYIARDEALARRFSTIKIDEPSGEETRHILTHARQAFEVYHDIRISEEAIGVIVDLADRYLHVRSFPDKAFDLLDKAAAKATMAGIESLTRECVTGALSEITGLPLEIMDEDPAARLERLEEFLNSAVPGQARAARDIARVVRIAKLHLELRPERPDGVFLFVGVEGAGKHEMAAALAKFLYGSAHRMVDFDMSQFTESWSLSRLVGAEPGYVGYGERSGLLSKAVEDNPHSLLYFRNIDLAHPVIQQFLGEVIEQGRFTDAAGSVIALSNTTIIMARSPLRESNKSSTVGFFPSAEEGEVRLITGTLKTSGSLKLRERGSGDNLVEGLVAAIDEVIEFQVLDRAATEQIVRERLSSLRQRLEAAQPVTITMDEALVAYFVDRLIAERQSPAQLERLWKDCIVIPFTNLLPRRAPGSDRLAVHIGVRGAQVSVTVQQAPRE